MITASVTHAIAPSFAIAYGKNGLPWVFRIEYSRRYCSFSRASMRSDLLSQEVLLLGLEPGRGGGAELGHEVEVGADQGGDQTRNGEHVERVEPRDGRGAELRAHAQEVREVGADDR